LKLHVSIHEKDFFQIEFNPKDITGIMFDQFKLDVRNSFNHFSKGVKLENITKGRKGAVLTHGYKEVHSVIRTTTPYKNPPQMIPKSYYAPLIEIHNFIRDQMGYANAKMFNNAMVEVYDPRYRTMGYHTDQMLDLEPNSFICIFSCYEFNSNSKTDWRKLIIKDKDSQEEFEIDLEHNSCVVFHTATNKHMNHKIILDSNLALYRWLGITLRVSQSYILSLGSEKYLCKNPFNTYGKPSIVLTMATDEQKKQYYKLKGKENREKNFEWPEISYTISPSDLMKPIGMDPDDQISENETSENQTLITSSSTPL